MTRETALLVSMLIHVPVVVTWIAFVAVEAAAITLPGIARGQRARIIRALRWPTVLMVVIIMATGVYQTIDNPFQTVTSWATLEKLRHTTIYGTALYVKHAFVLGTFALSVLTRFPLAGRLSAAEVATETARPGGPLAWAVWLNILLCLATILATTRMTIALH